ncbi:hypothetical protein [Nostoc sp. DedSLP04]|nr:hypothetical protein [Nostoc sp. DedSLP04]MDZ8035711.1 hypothetical protein [Nostoc sp. DedSLP04]
MDTEVTCSRLTGTLEADEKRVGVARRRHRLEEKQNFALQNFQSGFRH